MTEQERTSQLQAELAAWLQNHTEVSEVDDLGDGIYGVRLYSGDAISVVIQPTQ